MSLSLALVLAAGAAYADLGAVDRAVEAFAGAPLGAPGGPAAPVDRRLRLKPCLAPLAVGWNGQRRDSAVVRCPDAGGWRLFVAIAAAPGAHAASAAALPAISRGDPVTIAVSGDGFTVSQPGEALEGGAVGAWIRVRTLAAGARAGPEAMRAQVVRPGVVAVPLP